MAGAYKGTLEALLATVIDGEQGALNVNVVAQGAQPTPMGAYKGTPEALLATVVDGEMGAVNVNVLSGGGGPQFQTLTPSNGAATWDVSKGSARIVLTGDVKITPTNMDKAAGQTLWLLVAGDGNGSHTITWAYPTMFATDATTVNLVAQTPAVMPALFMCDGTYLYFPTNGGGPAVGTVLIIESWRDIAGLVGWWRAADIAGHADNDPVASWPDSSGNGHALIQATGAKQPIYNTAVLNGLAVVTFDDVNDAMTSTLDPGTASAVFVVFRVTSAVAHHARYAVKGANAWFLGVETDGATDLVGLDNGGGFATFNPNGGDGVPLVQNDWFIVNPCQGADGNGEIVSVNATTGIGTRDKAYNMAGTQPGALSLGDPAGAHPLGGQVAEVLVYNRILTGFEYDTIIAYLDTEYNLNA